MGKIPDEHPQKKKTRSTGPEIARKGRKTSSKTSRDVMDGRKRQSMHGAGDLCMEGVHEYGLGRQDYHGQVDFSPQNRDDTAAILGAFVSCLRIGEAKNPGPVPKINQLLAGKKSEENKPNKKTWEEISDDLTIRTVNITSWEGKKDWANSQKEEVVLLQETKLNPKGCEFAENYLKDNWKFFGEPAYKGSNGGLGGGVAIMVRKPRQAKEVHIPGQENHSGRLKGVVVETTKKTSCLVISVYGYDGRSQDDDDKNEDLQRVINDFVVQRGNVDWIAGGDWNRTAEELSSCTRTPGRKWRLPRGGEDFTTSVRGRRIDYFAHSRTLVNKMVAEEKEEDLEIADHAPVIVKIKGAGKIDKVPQIDSPEKIEMKKGRHQVEKESNWVKGIARQKWAEVAAGTLEEKYEVFNAIAEMALQAAYPKFQKGRGKKLRIKWVETRRTREDKVHGAIKESTRQKLCQIRRAKELVKIKKKPRGNLAAEQGIKEKIRKKARESSGLPDEPGDAIQDIENWITKKETEYYEEIADTNKARKIRAAERMQENIKSKPAILHAITRGLKKAEDVAVENHEGHTFDRNAVLEDATRNWAKLWCPPGGKKWEPINDQEQYPKVDHRKLHKIATRIPPNAAGGADGWDAKEIRVLPEWVWKYAAQIMDQAEERRTWPNQMHCGTVVLIPKEGAKTTAEMRPIVLLPFFYRIWAASRRLEIKKWEVGIGAHPSDPLGRGAPDSAIILAAEAEIGSQEGKHTAAVLIDCAKAYERVPHEQLRKDIIQTKFPARMANMAMDIYAHGRHLRIGEASGRQIDVTSSLMPGCALAVALLKAHTKSILEHPEGPEAYQVTTHKYVDDIKAFKTHHNPKELAEDLVKSYRNIAEGLKSKGAMVNTKKTVFVGTTPSVRKEIAALLEENEPKVVATTKDLGVDIAWRRREKITTNKRVAEGCRRGRRIASLGGAGEYRKTLVATNMLAHAMYGAHINGLSAAQLEKLTNQARISIEAKPKSGSMKEVALLLESEPRKVHPRVRYAVQVIQEWTKAAKRDKEWLIQSQGVWEQCKGRKLKGGVRGPIRTCYEVVKEIGWNPSETGRWITPEGQTVDVLETGNIAELVERSAVQREWRRLLEDKNRRQGTCEGIQRGVDPNATMAVWTKWRSNGIHTKAGALKTILAGATWPNQIRAKRGEIQDPTCPHCKEAEESAYHRWWQCPAHQKHRLNHAIKERMAEAGFRLSELPDCFTNYGLVPESMAAETRSRDMQESDNRPQGPRKDVRKVWTDGSAINPRDPARRRAGWAVYYGNEDIGCQRGTLKGKNQTVFRAELKALVHAVETTRGRLIVYTDCQSVEKVANQEVINLQGPNADLWARFVKETKGREIDVQWMSAHLTEAKALEKGYTREMWKGNQVVDIEANKAAKEHEGNHKQQKAVTDLIQAAQRMMADILMSIMDKADPDGENEKTKVRTSKNRQRKKADMATTVKKIGQHKAVAIWSGGSQCLQCLKVKKGNAIAWQWAKTPCVTHECKQAQNRLHEIRTIGGRKTCIRCGRHARKNDHQFDKELCLTKVKPNEPADIKEQLLRGVGTANSQAKKRRIEEDSDCLFHFDVRDEWKRRRIENEGRFQTYKGHELWVTSHEAFCEKCGETKRRKYEFKECRYQTKVHHKGQEVWAAEFKGHIFPREEGVLSCTRCGASTSWELRHRLKKCKPAEVRHQEIGFGQLNQEPQGVNRAEEQEADGQETAVSEEPTQRAKSCTINGHDLRFEGGRWQCRKCGNSQKKKDIRKFTEECEFKLQELEGGNWIPIAEYKGHSIQASWGKGECLKCKKKINWQSRGKIQECKRPNGAIEQTSGPDATRSEKREAPDDGKGAEEASRNERRAKRPHVEERQEGLEVIQVQTNTGGKKREADQNQEANQPKSKRSAKADRGFEAAIQWQEGGPNKRKTTELRPEDEESIQVAKKRWIERQRTVTAEIRDGEGEWIEEVRFLDLESGRMSEHPQARSSGYREPTQRGRKSAHPRRPEPD